MLGKYLILLDCGCGRVIKIRLSAAERRKAKEYEEPEEFISEVLEGKYGFSLTYCSWMTTDSLEEVSYNM